MSEDYHKWKGRRVRLTDAGRRAGIGRRGKATGVVVDVVIRGGRECLQVRRNGLLKAEDYDPAMWELEQPLR